MILNTNSSVAELRNEIERKRKKANELQMNTTDPEEWDSFKYPALGAGRSGQGPLFEPVYQEHRHACQTGRRNRKGHNSGSKTDQYHKGS